MRIWQRQTKKQSFSDVLAVCLDEANGPGDVERCLERYPEYAAQLRPLLSTAMSVRRSMATPLREDRRLAARQQFLQAAARQSQTAPGFARERIDGPHLRGLERTPSVLQRPLWSTFAPAMAAALLFVVALIPIMSITSVNALPGDWNYGFKRSTERIRLALALDPADRLNLELAFHNRRLGEIERLAADGRLTDPSLLEAFTSESSALVQTVSSDPQLGPSEALKVAAQTQAQVQALSDVVAPLASASVKPAIESAVEQSQQVQAKAAEVAQNKEDSATHSPASSATATATATATSSALATATATATETATATATTPVTAAVTATPVIKNLLVPPPQAPLLLPTAPPSSVSAAAGSPPPPPPLAQRSGVTARTSAEPSQPPPPPPPSPAAEATPLTPPSQPTGGQKLYTQTLPPGQRTPLVYLGPEKAIPDALASIAGAYDAVFFTQPSEHGGQVFEYYPGKSDPSEFLEPGSQITIEIKPGAPATLSYTYTPVTTEPSH